MEELLLAAIALVVLDRTLFLWLADAVLRSIGTRAKYRKELVPRSVQVRRGPKLCRLIGRLPRSVNPAAITFASTIILNRRTELTSSLLAHELEHVRQYRRLGFFGFLAIYIALALIHGSGNAHPLERRAEAMEPSSRAGDGSA